MAENVYAVFIGVNACADPALPKLLYAEKDCADLYSILADPKTGMFPPANATLLLGRDATTQAVQRTLRQEVVLKRRPEDVVILYFSGHGFVRELGGKKRTYLGTHDVSIADVTSYPTEGLDVEFLHNEIFTATAAKTVLLVLDCCHSGAIVPARLRDAHPPVVFEYPVSSRHSLDLVGDSLFLGGVGRVALVACPANAEARECDRLENGIFTSFLMKGLRGAAAEIDTGEVTLDSLASFLRSAMPQEQPPGRYGQDFGRLVLTRPGRRNLDETGEIFVPGLLSARRKPARAPRIESLPHPLGAFDGFLRDFFALLADVQAANRELRVEHAALQALRAAMGAEVCLLINRSAEKLLVKAQDSCAGGSRLDLPSLIPLIPIDAVEAQANGQANHGVSFTYRAEKGRRTGGLILPVSQEPRFDFVVLLGLDKGSPFVSDTFARIVAAIVAATRKWRNDGIEALESLVLDELKQSLGFMPLPFYERRLELFRASLRSMTPYFQPIFYLDPEHPRIEGWEALARNRAGHTPIDLFSAAELWGRRFMAELDCHFLETDTTQYRSRHPRDAAHPLPELSINVYPQSLMSDQYYASLREVLGSRVVQAERLVLELSEKMPVHSTQREGYTEDEALTLFRNRLELLVHDFRIAFAIDDFGVRQASVSHLARLNPEHVKIDRDALLHQYSDLLIKFVLDVTLRGRLASTKVVIEGFHTDSRVSLLQLYEMGVRYVQGFSLGEPSPELYLLDETRERELRRLLEAEKRPTPRSWAA